METSRVRLRHLFAGKESQTEEQQAVSRVAHNHRKEDTEEAKEHGRHIHFLVPRRNADDIVQELHGTAELAVGQQRRDIVVFGGVVHQEAPAVFAGGLLEFADTRSRAETLYGSDVLVAHHRGFGFDHAVVITHFEELVFDRFARTRKFTQAFFDAGKRFLGFRFHFAVFGKRLLRHREFGEVSLHGDRGFSPAHDSYILAVFILAEFFDRTFAIEFERDFTVMELVQFDIDTLRLQGCCRCGVQVLEHGKFSEFLFGLILVDFRLLAFGNQVLDFIDKAHGVGP